MFLEVPDANALDAAFARLAEAEAHALYLVDDALFAGLASSIVERARRASIGAISTLYELTAAGALASYGTDFPQLNHEAALYVGRILKGEKAANLPRCGVSTGCHRLGRVL
jgi:putative ABC transport system substrate-binding protein